ncbi:hypothetical protein EV694_2208, partial [Volucribacter psittacicida]
ILIETTIIKNFQETDRTLIQMFAFLMCMPLFRFKIILCILAIYAKLHILQLL